MKKNSGIILYTILILLTILSLVALNNTEQVRLQPYMLSAYSHKQKALQFARAELIKVKALLKKQFFMRKGQEFCDNKNQCFNNSCTNHLCKSFNFNQTKQCQPLANRPWKNKDLWPKVYNNFSFLSNKNNKLNSNWIIEFRCYIKKTLNPDKKFNPKQWFKYYRITVKVTSKLNATEIMLQSNILKYQLVKPDNTKNKTIWLKEIGSRQVFME